MTALEVRNLSKRYGDHVTATAVAVLGSLITRPGLRGRWLLDGIATLPLATPGIVIAVAVIVVWNQPFMPGGFYESLMLAVTCAALLAVRSLAGKLAPLGP